MAVLDDGPKAIAGFKAKQRKVEPRADPMWEEMKSVSVMVRDSERRPNRRKFLILIWVQRCVSTVARRGRRRLEGGFRKFDSFDQFSKCRIENGDSTFNVRKKEKGARATRHAMETQTRSNEGATV